MGKVLLTFIISWILACSIFTAQANQLKSEQQNLLLSSESSKLETAQAGKKEQRISINNASAEELAAHLKGIGLNKAKRIVEYREKYGLFTRIEQLQEVPGIGQATYQKNEELIEL